MMIPHAPFRSNLILRMLAAIVLMSAARMLAETSRGDLERELERKLRAVMPVEGARFETHNGEAERYTQIETTVRDGMIRVAYQVQKITGESDAKGPVARWSSITFH